jgi:hypothetical protein
MSAGNPAIEPNSACWSDGVLEYRIPSEFEFRSLAFEFEHC